MVVGAKVCELTDGFLWFVCGLYVGFLTSPLKSPLSCVGFMKFPNLIVTISAISDFEMAPCRMC